MRLKGPRSRVALVWMTVVATVLLVAILVVVAGAILLNQQPVRQALATRLHSPPPEMAAKPFELRESMLRERDLASNAGEMFEVAAVNAYLAQEASVRALAVHRAWLNRRDADTKLYGQNTSADGNVWNYRNSAADFFCFHLHAALRLNPTGMPSLVESLDAEQALRTPDGLCRPINSDTGAALREDHEELLFGTSEYCKDGLLSVYERHGGELIGRRLFTLLDALLAQSRHQSRYGLIPGSGAEINGNLLQLCSRLSLAADNPKYAEFAARIAEAVINQSMPANHGLPPDAYDYANNKVVDPIVKLKDHGNEIVLGLAEVYALAVSKRSDPAWSDRAGRWAEPLANMFLLILEHGTNSDGLIVSSLQTRPSGPRPTTTTRLCDNWGYILSGAVLYTQAARRHGVVPAERIQAIETRVDELIAAILRRSPPKPWDGTMDSEADAVESAIYMAASLPRFRQQLLRWADHQIALMYSQQTGNGLAGGSYLDGNFIRTSLLYADARAGGWRLVPWRADLRVGFAVRDDGPAYLVVSSDDPYTGNLIPDTDRHRTLLHLPWNWPRLNSWPEWNVPTADLRVISVNGLGSAQFSSDGPSAAITLPANGSLQIVLDYSGATRQR